MPICIYCDEPDRDSESHIIPEALGRGPTLEPGVCAKCNHRINKDVEEPIVKGLAAIRHYLQLSGKRGERAALDIDVSYGDKRQKVSAKNPIELQSRPFVFKEVTDRTGEKKNIVFISFDESVVTEKREEYEGRHADTKLKAIPVEKIVKEFETTTTFDLDVFADPRCLRMAAKIALEWWCKNRDSKAIKSEEYSDIVRYILDDQNPGYAIVSMVGEDGILRQFWPIPFGLHVLFISTHGDSKNLVVLVGLFGLVYYKVIVTRAYPRLHTYQQLNLINPQTGYMDEFDNRIKPLSPSKLLINEITERDNIAPKEIVTQMKTLITDRLNQGLEKIWEESRRETAKEGESANVKNVNDRLESKARES